MMLWQYMKEGIDVNTANQLMLADFSQHQSLNIFSDNFSMTIYNYLESTPSEMVKYIQRWVYWPTPTAAELSAPNSRLTPEDLHRELPQPSASGYLIQRHHRVKSRWTFWFYSMYEYLVVLRSMYLTDGFPPSNVFLYDIYSRQFSWHMAVTVNASGVFQVTGTPLHLFSLGFPS